MNNRKQKKKADTKIAKLWRSLRRRIKSDEHAADLIYKELTEANLLVCSCGSTEFDRESGARSCKCLECREEIWFTSNMFFKKAKLLRAYLAAIWFQQNDAVITPAHFAKLLRIAYSTAWEILHKVKMVIASHLPPESMQAPYKVFIDIVFRRSLESTKFTHPSFDCPSESGAQTESENSSEQNVSEENSSEQKTSENNPTDAQRMKDFTDVEAEVYSWLSDQPVSLDTMIAKGKFSVGQIMGALGLLEIENLVTVFAYGYYARKTEQPEQRIPSNQAPAAIIAQLVYYIRIIHRGVSRKYLQLFLAQIWCAFDKLRWGKNAVMQACLVHPPISRADILAYASPMHVRLGF